MLTSTVRLAAAVLVAGIIALAITVAPAARAVSGIGPERALSHLTGKADRLRVPAKGAACSQNSWPNFEPKCQFDLRETANEARIVRIIVLQ